MGTELLPGHTLPAWDQRVTARKRRICKFTGHFWYAVDRDESTGRTVLECRRCFPHKDSILVGYLYDLLPEVVPDDEAH